jgi:hypothetical protein
MNPDKHIKENLLNYYKQDIDEKRMQIENFINYEKINDKLYIDNIKKNNLEEKIRQESERKKRVNNNFFDYAKYMNKKDEERRNKYQKNSNTFNDNYNSLSMGNLNKLEIFKKNNCPSSPSYSPFNINPDMTLINLNRVKKDNVTDILYPKYIEVNRLNEIEKNNKNEYQKFYRNILDSLVNYKNSSSDYMENNNYKNVGKMISSPCKKNY